MRVAGLLLSLLLCAASASAYPQTLTYSGCELPPDVLHAFDTTLSIPSLAKLPTADREALHNQVLNQLLQKHPREYQLLELQLQPTDFNAPDYKQQMDALRQRAVENAKEHPDDALMLLLAGKALVGKDTPEAIRLMEEAKTKAPEFPWPAHELSAVYWRGRYADDAKMKENLERFYSLCPAWTAPVAFQNQLENFRIQTDLPLFKKLAAALRTRLEHETSPERLLAYQVLWQREFLTRPPSEHDAEREQIRSDLKRLESLVPNGDAAWRTFLIEGYKLSGASNDQLAKLQEAAAHDFPHTKLAEDLLWEQFRKEHPLPDGQRNAAAWTAYYAAEISLAKQLIEDFPDDVFAQRSQLFQIALEDDSISRQDGLAALNRYLAAMDQYGGYGALSFMPNDPPGFLLDHGWEPERALDLLKKTTTYKDGGHTKTDWADNISAADLKRFQSFQDSQDRATLGLILKALTLTHKPSEALRFRAAVEEAPPASKDALEQYWTNRARFAALENRPQDATVYYRNALESRTHPPEYHHGMLRDELMAESHSFWIAHGGTEAAWTAAAATHSENKTQESDWEKVSKKMPPFDLSDLPGKMWRQQDLRGKVVVIVSWATWCGPCRLQDKLVQKFYDNVKDRTDLAVLTFNVDDNPGEVLPFMRQEGYTFPVLLAHSYADAATVVPRTWIVDANGNWRWMKEGYDEQKTYAEFEQDMLDRIAKTRAANVKPKTGE